MVRGALKEKAPVAQLLANFRQERERLLRDCALGEAFAEVEVAASLLFCWPEGARLVLVDEAAHFGKMLLVFGCIGTDFCK